MATIFLSGCCGRMGRMIAAIASQDPDINIAAGCDILTEKYTDFPVYADLHEYPGHADVLVDFSNPSSLNGILDYCISRRLPAVLCTTGYSPAQLEQIQAASSNIPVFRSGNMSIGINLLLSLIRKAVPALPGFDIEIVEKHHNKKLDAPSGTAMMLAEAAAGAMPEPAQFVYERESVRQERQKNEIGISSIRGGTIPGEHSVIFAGRDEVIELKHTVFSREVFASGALQAAKYMVTVKEPGLYSMADVIG